MYANIILRAGSMVTILQDNIYIPDNFVEATLQFHKGTPRHATPPDLHLQRA
jgi:hypothetical protein